MGDIESMRIEAIFIPLRTELKLKERFLEMRKIKSLRPIDIKFNRHTETWERIEKESRKPQIPKNLRSTIEKFYRDYEEFIDYLTRFVIFVQELSHEKMSRFFDFSFLDDLVGILVRSLFLERKRDFRLIVSDSFSELGKKVTGDQLEEFFLLLPEIESYGLPTFSDIENLGIRMNILLAQIKPIIEHIEKIIESDNIFDIPCFDLRGSEEGSEDKGLKIFSFEYDVFVCHAGEDKESFVRELVKKLTIKGLKVWYDEFTLLLGDSLRGKIDLGLSRSRYGVVVLSKSFFAKEWPQKELDGLVAREDGSAKVILPIWHGVTKKEVQSFSPILAGRFAASSDKGIDYVVSEILKVCRPAILDSSEPKIQKGKSTTAEKVSKFINGMIRRPSGSEIQEGRSILRAAQVIAFWIVLSPFLLRCNWTNINIVLIPLFSLSALAIWPISLRIATNFVVILYFIYFFVLIFASIVCGTPLFPEIGVLLLLSVNVLAAVIICRLRRM